MSKPEYWIFRKLYKHRYLLAAAVIIIVAGILRLYKLGEIPSGITWDEAAIGYDGYAVLTTRRDQWLERLPISFKSFGDYKAPLAIYLNGPFTYILGLTPFAVRLPFALSGITAVIGMMLLFNELWRKYPHTMLIALLSGAILTLSPWHLQFTRVGFESGLALTLIIWGTYLFILSWRVFDTNFWKRSAILSISALLFVASLYTYHSTKLFTPLWVLFLAFIYRKEVMGNIKTVVISGIVGILAVIPLVYDALYGNGLERAGVTVFSREESVVAALSQSFQNFLTHFTPQFLIFGETNSFRHGDGVWGVLFSTTAFLVLLGISWFIYSSIRNRDKYQTLLQRALFLIIWIVLGILPAAISTEAPHSNRSLMALPGFIGLAIIGLIWFHQWLKSSGVNKTWVDGHGNGDLLTKTMLGILATTHVFLFAAYFSHYIREYPATAPDAFNEGYLRALKIAKNYELGENGYPRVDQIIVSSQYGQPVIYTLFTKGISPIRYQQGGLINYLYLDEVTEADLHRKNSLVVATKYDEVLLDEADHKIYGSNGEIRFGLFLTSP